MTGKIMIKSLLVNFGLTILKLLGSFFSHSKTLMGDAVHCLSDMATDIVGLIGSKLSNKKPDKKHPYGYGKIEYLTSIIMSIFIIFLGINIIYNSFSGEVTKPNYYVIILMIFSIIIKLSLSSYLLKKGKELNSNILLTNGIESRYDSYCSILGIVFITLTLLSSKNKIFLYADMIGGVLTSLLTIKVGLNLLFENISGILGEVETDKEKLNLIKNVVENNDLVTKVEEITLLKFGSYYNATITTEMNGKITLNEMYIAINKIKNSLKTEELNIKYININAIPEKI